MTTAFFIRHGPTQENQQGRIQGQTPGTLLARPTEHYIAAITPLLRARRIDTIITSDLARAMETARILKDFLQLQDIKEQVTPLLREKAMGFYEGMLWQDVPPIFREQRGLEEYNFRLFGGENDEDVMGRVEAMLRRIVRIGPNIRVCCVTHAGWIKQLVRLAHQEGIPDGWSDRTAIYEAAIGPHGQLKSLQPLAIIADLPDDND